MCFPPHQKNWLFLLCWQGLNIWAERDRECGWGTGLGSTIPVGAGVGGRALQRAPTRLLEQRHSPRWQVDPTFHGGPGAPGLNWVKGRVTPPSSFSTRAATSNTDERAGASRVGAYFSPTPMLPSPGWDPQEQVADSPRLSQSLLAPFYSKSDLSRRWV